MNSLIQVLHFVAGFIVLAEALPLGIRGYIIKPPTIDAMRTKIDVGIGHREVGRVFLQRWFINRDMH